MAADTYRPENVRVERVTGGPYGARLPFLVSDHDGTPLSYHETLADAEAHARSRRGVIRAALTRRANKASR